MKKWLKRLSVLALTLTVVVGMAPIILPIAAAELSSTIPIISAGGGHTIVRGSDGGFYSWGRNNRGQLGDGSVVDRSAPVRAGY